jgi:hypothetical protein
MQFNPLKTSFPRAIPTTTEFLAGRFKQKLSHGIPGSPHGSVIF